MYPLDAMKTTFDSVEILTIPGLFTTERINRSTVPKGMFAYDLQTSAEDWGIPGIVGHHITVEHYGTVLTASPIPLSPIGYLDLAPGDFSLAPNGERLTVAGFERKYLSPDLPIRPAPHRQRHHPQRSVAR